MPDFGVSLDGDDTVRATLADAQETLDSAPEYVVGTNVEYAVYLEFGTSKMPPYPFLGPAVRDVVEGGEADEIADESETPSELVRKLAFAIERQAKQNAAADQAGDRSPGTHAEHPQVDTGTLRASIQAKRIR